MGGYGSGQRFGYTKRLVENSLTLPVSFFKAHLKRIDNNDNGIYMGSCQWSIGEKPTANIGYQINKENGVMSLKLIYQTGGSTTKEKTKHSYSVEIQETYPNFGGKRYWFTCPLIVKGIPCNRRVTKLYFPPGSHYFGCRECHDLTYLSCNESHKWDKMFIDMGFDPSIEKLLRKRKY